MKKTFRYIIVSLLIPVLASCADNPVMNPEPDNPVADEDTPLQIGETGVSLFVEDFDPRTRDIEFARGSSVRINSLWLGVFDIETGECVDKLSTIQNYKFLTSGEVAHNSLRVSFKGPKAGYTGKGNFFMVAVANYNGSEQNGDVDAVRGRDGREAAEGTDKVYTLADLLDKVETWEDFNHIGVDTKSAYSGDHLQDAPVMAGFLNDSKAFQANIPSSTHVKVNQFKSQTGDVELLPEKLINGTLLKTALTIKWNPSVQRYVDNKTGSDYLEDHMIFFRRLVANINIIVSRGADSPDATVAADSDPNVEILSVGYRRFNLPNNVYIVERSLLDPSTNAFPTTEKAFLSPNFADLNPSLGYYDDDDNAPKFEESESSHSEEEPVWTQVSPDEDGFWNFSFQHFANKHWARTAPQTYEERANIAYKDKILYFPVLADGPEDINNNASYYKLKLHLLNKVRNRCSEAEYTIAEGYTSDEDGYDFSQSQKKLNETDFKKYILKDFSTARNIDYKVNIRVHSFGQLQTNIKETTNEHRPDVGGRVWQMHYTGESFTYNNEVGDNVSDFHYNNDDMQSFSKYLTPKGGKYKEAFIINTAQPDLSFRLYGYNSQTGLIEGYNYNFPDNSFTWLRGLWPASANYSHYYKDNAALIDDYYDTSKNTIETLLFETFHIIPADEYSDTYEDVLLVTNRQGEKVGYRSQNSSETKVWDGRQRNYWMDIVQFIQWVGMQSEVTIVGKKFHISVSPRQVSKDPNRHEAEYVRALYLTDRKGTVDSDGCTRLVDVYATVQGIQ